MPHDTYVILDFSPIWIFLVGSFAKKRIMANATMLMGMKLHVRYPTVLGTSFVAGVFSLIVGLLLLFVVRG